MKNRRNRFVPPTAHRETQDELHLGAVGNWQASDVVKLISNPIYAGVGPYPPMMSDADWVRAASKVIKEVGRERFLLTLLENLREAFPVEAPPDTAT
jgi:hypothetical protein